MEIDPPLDSCPIPALPPPVPVRLTMLPEHDCPYLPGRPARSRGFMTDRMPGDVYHQFMNAGFRRSGRLFYQPVCRGCRQCVPIRIPTATFQPTKSQRRVLRKNADVTVEVGPAVATDEKYLLYSRYLAARHDRQTGEDGPDAFRSFLYDSPVDTVEFRHRDRSGRLIGIGIADVCGASLSSVYFFFDPVESARSLGTFSALTEIDWARHRRIGHYYLGFFIDGCRKMAYKKSFVPSEYLSPDGIWRTDWINSICACPMAELSVTPSAEP